jgi:Zn-dependent protease with chaperone function
MSMNWVIFWFSFAVVSISLSIAIWFLFGRAREIQKRAEKTAVTFLTIIALGICLLSSVVPLTFSMIEPYAEQIGEEVVLMPGTGFVVMLFCLIPGFVLLLLSGGIWFWRIRPSNTLHSNESENKLPSSQINELDTPNQQIVMFLPNPPANDLIQAISSPSNPTSPQLHSKPSKQKLNILVLPSFTTAIAILITFVILGILLAAGLPGSQIWSAPFILGVIFLSLRDFLKQPDRELHGHELSESVYNTEPLQEITDELSQGHIAKPPHCIVNRNAPVDQPRAIGSFRRRFISFNPETVAIIRKEMAANPNDKTKIRAIIAHELSHFLNHDSELIGLTRSLLKMTALVALASMWMAISTAFLAIATGEQLLKPEQWGDLAFLGEISFVQEFITDAIQRNPIMAERLSDASERQSLQELFLYSYMNFYLVFLFGLPLLYLFLWHKLLRVREFYADARAASLIENTQDIFSKYFKVIIQTNSQPSPAPTLYQKIKLRGSLFIEQFFPSHPKMQQRKEALNNPLIAFGTARQIGAWVGFATLLFEFVLRSELVSPLLPQPSSHLPLLTATIVFTIWLLPRICQGRTTANLFRNIVEMTSVFILIKLTPTLIAAMLLTPFVFLLREWPNSDVHWINFLLNTLLGIPIHNIVATLGNKLDIWYILELGIIRPLVYFVFFATPTLIAVLSLDTWLKQQVLTWYVLDKKIKRVFGGITVALAMILILVFIPIANRLVFPSVYTHSWLFTIAGIIFGGFISLGLIGIFLLYKDKANRCPGCRQPIADNFFIGLHCPHPDCEIELHSWLIAPY